VIDDDDAASGPSTRAYERLAEDDALAEVMLPSLRTRQDLFDYLEGHSVEAAEELVQRRTQRTLLKTYVLETRGGGLTQEQCQHIFRRAGHTAEPEAEGELTVLVANNRDRRWALVEYINNRYMALHTLVPANVSDRAVKELVEGSPTLDRLWLSPTFFDHLWRGVTSRASPRQFARMTFAYDALYESAVPLEDVADDEDPLPPRAARMRLADTVATINATLPGLRSVYQPLRSIVHIRAPAQEQGGHDIYYDGKLTNRSPSFAEHRSLMRFVAAEYDSVTRRAEEALWPALTEDRPSMPSPLYIRFAETLSESTFDRWVTDAFNPRGSRLRLWGKPIRLGRNKAHVYAVDQHLWQPIQLELTRQHLLALLPRGTCGNSVNRLVTNLQRTLDPSLEAWLADQNYTAMLGPAAA
jgi:hypothetical protein